VPFPVRQFRVIRIENESTYNHKSFEAIACKRSAHLKTGEYYSQKPLCQRFRIAAVLPLGAENAICT